MSGSSWHSKYVPFQPGGKIYVGGSALFGTDTTGLQPFEYNGWMVEMLASHNGCYLHAGLNPAATSYYKGVDVLKMFSEISVNSYKNFRIGTGKHCVMCDENGYIVKDGMLLRLSEDEFIGFQLLPYTEYAEQKGNYDGFVSKNISGQVFFYQLAGPTSLEIVERITGDDFHDLKFSNFRMSQIDGRKVMILRMGMAGSLAYEVHGLAEDAIYIYNRLLEVGKDLGICQIGTHVYRNVHTEGGFPQQSIHYSSAMYDPGYAEFLKKKGLARGKMHYSGSAGTAPYERAATPIDVGWGRLVKFDHDFIGREALEKAMEKPRRTPVTLEWNKEDILDIWKSAFEPGEPYPWMDLVEDYSYAHGGSDRHTDRVLANGNDIGISSGRMYSPYDREMISLGFIDPKYSTPGTELVIIWGEPDKRQKVVRCVVAKYPYLNEGGHAD